MSQSASRRSRRRDRGAEVGARRTGESEALPEIGHDLRRRACWGTRVHDVRSELRRTSLLCRVRCGIVWETVVGRATRSPLWQTLLDRVGSAADDPRAWLRERLLPPLGAFIVAFVVVVLIGTVVLPDVPHRRMAKRPAVPNAIAPRPRVVATLLPFMPPSIGPRRRHERTGATLSIENQATVNRVTPAALSTTGPASPRTIPVPATPQTMAAPAAPQTLDAAVRSGRGGAGEVVRVTGVSLWGTAGKPWGSITATGPIRYQLRNVKPDWVVVDISPAQLALVPAKLPAGFGRVRQVRVGQFAENTVRVVLELTEATAVHIAASADRRAIIISFPAQPLETLSTPPRRVLPAGGA